MGDRGRDRLRRGRPAPGRRGGRALRPRRGELRRVEVADATEADLGAGYDRILLDPPCTDLGTLASRPDARWRKSPEDPERLAAIQRRMLVRAARALAPGGTLVYSTCTISAAENEGVAAALDEYVSDIEPDDLGSAHAGLASRRDPRFLQLLPAARPDDGLLLRPLSRRRG